MTRMTGLDCAVMCNLINIHTYILHTVLTVDQHNSIINVDITSIISSRRCF